MPPRACPLAALLAFLAFLCLPRALSRGLLLLALLDGSLASRSTCLWSLCAALLDHIEGCSDDGTLVLDRAAGAFLGNFLQSAMRVSKDVVSLVLQATEEWCVGVWYRDQGWCLMILCQCSLVLLTSEIPFLCMRR